MKTFVDFYNAAVDTGAAPEQAAVQAQADWDAQARENEAATQQRLMELAQQQKDEGMRRLAALVDAVKRIPSSYITAAGIINGMYDEEILSRCIAVGYQPAA